MPLYEKSIVITGGSLRAEPRVTPQEAWTAEALRAAIPAEITV